MSRKYVNAVKDDIIDYIKENQQYLAADFLGMDEDEIFEELEEKLWVADEVTGNGSGSYFFNSQESMEFIIADKFETVEEAIDEGMYSTEKLGEDIYEWNWETIDVVCRCLVLNQALSAAFEELGGAEKAIFGEE